MTFLEALSMAGWVVIMLLPPVLFLAAFNLSRRAFWRRIVELERLWSWLGQGEKVHGAGRAWAGEVEGRHVDVEWFERTLTVNVEGHPAGVVGFGRQDRPASIVTEAHEHVAPVRYDEEHLAFAEDPRVVEPLVRDPEVRGALDTLLEAEAAVLPAVRVDPERGVSWFVRNLPRGWGPDDAKRWVRALITVAKASERGRQVSA